MTPELDERAPFVAGVDGGEMVVGVSAGYRSVARHDQFRNLVRTDHMFEAAQLSTYRADAAHRAHRPARPTVHPAYPVTPDGRYFVVRGRLWRTTDPSLPEETRRTLTAQLMVARRAVGAARRSGDADARADARAQVDAAKRALGERGPVWWTDGAPDYNRHLAKNTPYRAWFDALPEAPSGSGIATADDSRQSRAPHP